jgi:hypothetical protein
MLLCKQARCMWHLVYIIWLQTIRRLVAGLQPKGTSMSKTTAIKTTAIALAPSSSLFGRLLATIDRLLMKSAEISNRNGDLPRFGL